MRVSRVYSFPDYSEAVRNRPLVVTGAILALVGVIWLLATGVGLWSSLLVIAALALQTLGGAYLWVLVRVQGQASGPVAPGTLEVIGMGLAIGTFMAMASGVLLAGLVPGGLGWMVPSVVVLVVWLVMRGRSPRLMAVGRPGRPVALSVAVGVVLGLGAALINIARYPLQLTGVVSSYHPDMLFFEGLANSAARFGPSESIFMAGAELRYHWFSYAWIGQLTESLALPPFVGLTRVLPLVVVVGSAAIAGSWVARHARSPWAPSLAVVLITAGGFAGAAYGTVLNFDSPSQAMTTVWLLGLSFVILEFVGGELGRRVLWMVGLLSVASTGGKASAVIVVIGALGLTLVAGLAVRASWRDRAFWALVVCAVPSAITYALVLMGSASSGDLRLLTWEFRASTVQGLNLGTGVLGIAAGTGILMLAVIPRWAGLVGLWLQPSTRWSPMSLFGAGLVVMGLAPLAVLSQGVNELWFALSASAPLAVISAIGLSEAWGLLASRSAGGSRRLALSAGFSVVTGLVLLAVVGLLWSQGGAGIVSARALGPLLVFGAAAVVGLVLVLGAGRSGSRWLTGVTAVITVLVSASALARLTPVFGEVETRSLETVSASLSVVADLPAGSALPAVGPAPVLGPGEEWSGLEVEAASFLADHTTASDTVVTNRPVSSLVPALTARRMFIAGSAYQALYGRPGDVAAIPSRMETSQRFAEAPGVADFAALCSAGVTWGWMSAAGGTSAASWEPFATVRFENDAVTLIQLDRSRC